MRIGYFWAVKNNTRMLSPIIKFKNVWLTFSGLLVAASVVLFFLWGLKLSIDFTGGSFIQVGFQPAVIDKAQVADVLEKLNYGPARVQPGGQDEYIIRMRFLSGEEYQTVADTLRELAQRQEGGQLIEKRFEIVGPAIGSELQKKAWGAIVAVLIAIVAYIAWAFRGVSKPVPSWKYGIAALVVLFHDIAIPVGIFSVLGRYFNIEIDILFVTALLAILGYSVDNTIVVFDRMREQLIRARGDKSFTEIVDASVIQTLGRSLNNSLTLFLVLLAIYLYGGISISYFILTMLFGVVIGTYTSIFVAGPLLLQWHLWTQRKRTSQ